MQIQKYKDTNAKISSGLVDGHTHPVWAGDRVHEFAMKLAGASYMEVLYSIDTIYNINGNFLDWLFLTSQYRFYNAKGALYNYHYGALYSTQLNEPKSIITTTLGGHLQ